MSQTDATAPGRVMFVSSITRYGGGERWMCDAAAGLGERGHDVMLVARPGSVLLRRGQALGVATAGVEMRSDLDPIAVGRLAGLVRRFRPRVVCVNLDREVRLCAAALALARTDTLLIPRRGSEFPLKNKWPYRFVYTKFVDRVITNSEATRKTMISRTPWFPAQKAVVIYNGIDVGAYGTLRAQRARLRGELRDSLGAPPDAAIVTLVGELNERKGHRFIIEAAGDVIARAPHAHFVFAGDGDAREEIRAQIESTGLDRHFHMVGFRDDVAQLLVASDVLVLPSRIEGFGYVLAEAMAAHLPVVASNTSSIPEIVVDGRTGLLHGVGDVTAIAAALVRLLGDADLRATMGAVGHEVVTGKFNLPRMIDQLEELFFAPASAVGADD